MQPAARPMLLLLQHSSKYIVAGGSDSQGPRLRQRGFVALAEVANHAAQLRLQLRRLIQHVPRDLTGVVQSGHLKQDFCRLSGQAGERAQLVRLRTQA